MKKSQDLKVAIVCDWLTGIGGAERVVLELHRLFPEAPIYTSQYDPNKINWFKDADVRTTMLQKLPKSLKKFLPLLRALSFSSLNLRGYDLVISSSGAEAKGVKVRPGAMHISYCHSPTHYYWRRYYDYLDEPGFGKLNPLARLGLRLLAGPMRRWDRKAAQRPTHMIANSAHIQRDIKQYYGRESTVIYPPVDTERFAPSGKEKRTGLVVAGRQTPYKRIDLAVEACSAISAPLTVLGSGPDHERIKALAGPRVKFVPHPTDQEMADNFRSATAFIFPGLDDFGIVAVEAMAAGTPVIAYKAGGAEDYVKEKVSGMFFTEQTPASLLKALEQFRASNYNWRTVHEHAQQFNAQAFRTRMTAYIQQVLNEKAS